MATFLRPGIFTQEVLTPLQPSGFGLSGESVACFAAPYNIGPAVPTLVTSWQNYVNLYGNFSQANGSYLAFAVYSFFANGGQACIVLRVPNTDATDATLTLVDIEGTPATLGTVTSLSPGNWANNIYIEIVTVGNAQHVTINVYYGGTTAQYLVEQWVNVSANPADSRFAPPIINSPVSGSQYISLTGVNGNKNTLAWHLGAYLAGSTDFAPIAPTQLSSGVDGVGAPAMATQVPLLLDAYCQDQILMLNLPGPQAASDINTIVAWAAAREDVLVYIDGPAPNFPETSATVASNYTSMLTGGSPITSSSYATIFGPYLNIQDPSSTNAGATRFIPPCASILGLQSVADTSVGVQQAAAGTSWGQIGAIGLETTFSTTDLNNLFAGRINPVKYVPGFGYCVFGARTLLAGYPDQYLSIRRILMKIEHDLKQITQFALFEPNQPSLWQAMTTVMTTYLNQQTQAGLFATQNSATAFQVICDASVNTPQSAQAGIVNATVAVALGSPAEIIVITIQQLQSSTSSVATSTTS